MAMIFIKPCTVCQKYNTIFLTVVISNETFKAYGRLTQIQFKIFGHWAKEQDYYIKIFLWIKPDWNIKNFFKVSEKQNKKRHLFMLWVLVW